MVATFSRLSRFPTPEPAQPRFADGKPYLVMLFTGTGFVIRPITAEGRRSGPDVTVGGWEHAKAVLAASTQKRGWVYQGRSKYSDHTLDGIGRCLVSHDVFAGIADELDARPIGADEGGPSLDLEAALDALIRGKASAPEADKEAPETVEPVVDQFGRRRRQPSA